MSGKDRLHRAIDAMSDEDATELLQVASQRRTGDDPVARLLGTAPLEDEPISAEEEEEAVAQARAERAAGEPAVSLDELRRELA